MKNSIFYHLGDIDCKFQVQNIFETTNVGNNLWPQSIVQFWTIYPPKSSLTKHQLNNRSIEPFKDSRPLCTHNVNASIISDFLLYIRRGLEIDIP